MERSFASVPPSPSPPLLAPAPCQGLTESTALHGQWAGQLLGGSGTCHLEVGVALFIYLFHVPALVFRSSMHAHWMAQLSLEDINSSPVQLTTLTCSIKSLIPCTVFIKEYSPNSWPNDTDPKFDG